MRIISGEYSSRIIKAPKGMDTRPTTDRVRESIMSSISSRLGSFEGICVLDAFAGSGAFGIECLSRGANSAVFIDKAKSAIDVISENLTTLRVDKSRFKVIKYDVIASGIPLNSKPFDLAYFDPPYKISPEEVIDLITDARSRGCFSEDALNVYEYDAENERSVAMALERANATSAKQKRLGKTGIAYFNI